MGDQLLLNDYLVTRIEHEFFKQVKDKVVISRFQDMKELLNCTSYYVISLSYVCLNEQSILHFAPLLL